MLAREYLIEFHQQGRYVKVTAIDPRTGREASIVGDAAASTEHLKKLAIKRLQYVVAKEAGAPQATENE